MRLLRQCGVGCAIMGQFWEKDGLMENAIEDFVIRFGGDDDDRCVLDDNVGTCTDDDSDKPRNPIDLYVR